MMKTVFVFRRDCPPFLWQVNGTNNIDSAKEIRQNVPQWDQRVSVDWFVKRGIAWRFNSLSLPSPGNGGPRERLMRTIEQISCTKVDCRRPTQEQFYTTLYLVKQRLDARPSVPANSTGNQLGRIDSKPLFSRNTDFWVKLESSEPREIVYPHAGLLRQKLEQMAHGVVPTLTL